MNPDIGCRGRHSTINVQGETENRTLTAENAKSTRSLTANGRRWTRVFTPREQRERRQKRKGSSPRPSPRLAGRGRSGSWTRGSASLPGSWFQCMPKVEWRLSMNRWTRPNPGCSADSLSAVSPTGSRQEVIFAASGPIADCQSAIQQTASLRYVGRFMVPMHAKSRMEAFHERGNIEPRQKEECRMQNPALPVNLGTSNIEHRMNENPHLISLRSRRRSEAMAGRPKLRPDRP